MWTARITVFHAIVTRGNCNFPLFSSTRIALAGTRYRVSNNSVIRVGPSSGSRRIEAVTA